jgi:short-subunit dehydrogenase
MITRERHGPWAVILGGSEGIGQVLADRLGAIGINLVLVSRRPETLEATAAQVRAVHGVEVRTLATDASRDDLPDRLRELTQGLEVGLFVHNVGGDPGMVSGTFVQRPLDLLLMSVMVNCVNLVKLIHHFAGPMAERHRGGILMFGSIGGNIGCPYISTYGASKAFEQNLAEALYAELEPEGVDVLDLVIGSADTPARQRSGTVDHELFRVVPVEEVVDQAFAHIGDGPVLVPAGYENLFHEYNAMPLPRREAAVHSRKMLEDMSPQEWPDTATDYLLDAKP